MFNGQKGPFWLSVLSAAEEWGTPPWEIAQGGSKVIWFLRWQAWIKERNAKHDMDMKELERQRTLKGRRSNG